MLGVGQINHWLQKRKPKVFVCTTSSRKWRWKNCHCNLTPRSKRSGLEDCASSGRLMFLEQQSLLCSLLRKQNIIYTDPTIQLSCPSKQFHTNFYSPIAFGCNEWNKHRGGMRLQDSWNWVEGYWSKWMQSHACPWTVTLKQSFVGMFVHHS